MRLPDRPAWQALHAHARDMGDVRILDLFARDPQRAQAFSIEACGMLLDYSKNPLSPDTRRLLVALADDANVPAQIAAMFEGRRIMSLKNAPSCTRRCAIVRSGRSRWTGRTSCLGSTQFSSACAAWRNAFVGASRGLHRPHIHRHSEHRHRRFRLGPADGDDGAQTLRLTGLRAHFVSNVDGATPGCHVGRPGSPRRRCSSSRPKPSQPRKH